MVLTVYLLGNDVQRWGAGCVELLEELAEAVVVVVVVVELMIFFLKIRVVSGSTSELLDSEEYFSLSTISSIPRT